MQHKWTEIKPDNETSSFDPTWDYEKDSTLIGVLVGIKEDVGKHHSKLYIIEREDKSRVTVWGSTVLDVRMSKVENGEYVKIDYLGDKPTDKGNPYHDFTVAHEPKVKDKIVEEEIDPAKVEAMPF